MSLAASSLQSALADIGRNPPASAPAAAAAWADAVLAYAASVTPPALPPAVMAAAAALQAALTTAFAAPGAAAAAMEAAFTTFGTAVGAAMAGFVPVPPAGPVGFADLFAVTRTSVEDAAEAVAGAIDTWMRSGSATPLSGGAAVPWT